MLRIGCKLAVGLGLWAGLVGCGVIPPAGGDNVNGNDNTGGGPVVPNVGEPSNQQVLVRFLNLSRTEAVDVQFYAAPSGVTTVPADLFAEAFSVTMSVGVAGSSLVTPGAGDQVLMDCTPNLILGTEGGAFRDAESGEPRGVGQPRWVQDSGIGLCGATVTFLYAGGGTQFETRITVE
jgi:hypothetical protein